MGTRNAIRRYQLDGYCVELCHDGEVDMWSGSSSPVTGGKGLGDTAAALRLWRIVLASARAWGLSRLYCEPCTSDGRGRTRERVYARLGFRREGSLLYLNL